MTQTRPPYFEPDGKTVTDAWRQTYGFFVMSPRGKLVHEYVPTPLQLEFHESTAPNCIIEGSRGTGKSVAIRNDAHMRSLKYPGYTYLIVRRTMPELKKSHLRFIDMEMKAFGGNFHKTDAIAYYPEMEGKVSQGFFSHCETEDDMLKLLSSEYCIVYFDEISTFTWTMITKISSCIRVPEGMGLDGLVRGGTNPIGVGADDVRRYYIVKDIRPEEDSEYRPEDYQAIHTTLDDNPHIDRQDYIRRLSQLPEHIRRAWLDGEWIVEGAYFHDFKPSRKLRDDEQIPPGAVDGFTEVKGVRTIDWHVTISYPRVSNRLSEDMSWQSPFQWLQVYRTVDWGFAPDPAICLWIASLPNGRAFVFKEKTWFSTPAATVANEIVTESAGMRIAETFCDPTMFIGSQATEYHSIGDIFWSNGVPLSPSVNDRAHAGFVIHEYLNTILTDGLPKLQIYEPGCPQLVRTIPIMRTHKTDPRKIANGNDHYVIALAYFCMGWIGQSREPYRAPVPRYLQPKSNRRVVLGAESVRTGPRFGGR